MSYLKIIPDYKHIELVRDVCEPWIDLWSGCEWGESMSGLLQGCHVDYALSDEDCAIVAGIMLKNVISYYEHEGYGWHTEEEIQEAIDESKRIRDEWVKDGAAADILPIWMFEKIDVEEDNV